VYQEDGVGKFWRYLYGLSSFCREPCSVWHTHNYHW
jgi:hypothetical protein